MIKKFKAIIAVVMALCMCSVLVSCGNSTSTPKNPDDMTEEDFEKAASELEASYGNAKNEASEAETEPVIEEVNPFEKSELLSALMEIDEWNGVSPLARLQNFSVDTGRYYSSMSSIVTYTPDKYKDLKNGDVVTVTAELLPQYEDKYILTETEKEFVIEGLPEYIQSAEDIPQEAYDKMSTTLCDTYTANLAKYHNAVINDMELLGNYVLTAKSSEVSGYRNYIYFVYKVTADFSEKDADVGVKEYYWCAYYGNVMALQDGTVSADYSELNMGTMSDFTVGAWLIEGCDDLDTLFNKNVTAQIDKYNYENTVTE